MTMAVTQRKNPYALMLFLSDPTTFYGSERIVESLLDLITREVTPAPIELLGLPRVGKTSIIQFIAHPNGAREKYRDAINSGFQDKDGWQLLPIVINFKKWSALTPAPNALDAFRYIYEQFYEQYSSQTNLTKLQDLEKKTVTAREEIVNGLIEHFKDLQKVEIRCVLFLDDFHLVYKHFKTDDDTQLVLLRDLVPLILSTEIPLLVIHRRKPGQNDSPLLQKLDRLYVGALTDQEVTRLMTEPLESEGNLTFPIDDIAYIRQESGDHAQLLIVAARFLWDLRQELRLLDKRDTPMSNNLQRVLRGYLQEDFDYVCRKCWDALDQESGSMNLRDTLAELRFRGVDSDLIEDENHGPNLAFLDKLDVVKIESNGNNDYYAFRSNYFREYVAHTDYYREYVAIHHAQPDADSPLSPLEGEIYDYLNRNAGRFCSPMELYNNVWLKVSQDEAEILPAPDAAEAEKIAKRVQVTISRLKPKLNGADIQNQRHGGYRLVRL